MISHNVPLSHIHSGYTSSEQPVQAQNSSVRCYTKMALNADAMFEFRPQDCDKGLTANYTTG